MIKDSILIRQATTNDVVEIINLFRSNYENGYYNKYFKSAEKLITLLEKQDFIGIVACYENKIVGFSGMYIQEKNKFTEIYLAHFLVDKNYRNMGVGKFLENYKSQIYKQYDNLTMIYSILGLNSYASINIKKSFGFKFWGIRQFYGEWEPNQDNLGHLVVVGKILNEDTNIKEFSNLHTITRILIKKCVKQCKFSNIDTKENITDILYNCE